MKKVLVEKYRPESFEDVLGNEHVMMALRSVNVIPHMIFYGPPGSGKTTAIRIMAKSLFHPRQVLELNASDERGIGVVRSTIKDFASTNTTNELKLVVLDESDFMSRDAQNAMRRQMEDFSHNVRFCLIANYINKIILPIQSRCSKFRFGPVDTESMMRRVRWICDREGIPVDCGGLEPLCKFSKGDMRTAINCVEGISEARGRITKQSVYEFCGTISDDVFDEILNLSEFDEIRNRIMELMSMGDADLSEILNGIVNSVRRKRFAGMRIFKDLGDIEYRISVGCSQSVQALAIAGAILRFNSSARGRSSHSDL